MVLIKNEELDYIDPILISQKVVATIFSGITTTELDTQSAEICVNLSTQHHYYSKLAGRILVSSLHKKTTNHFVDKMIKIQNVLGLLDEKWLVWIKKNKKEINAMIDYDICCMRFLLMLLCCTAIQYVSGVFAVVACGHIAVFLRKKVKGGQRWKINE